MSWSAVGSLNPNSNTGTTSFSLTPSGIGNLMVVEVCQTNNSTVTATALSSTNVTWTFVGSIQGTNFTPASTAALFIGKVTANSAATVTITWSGTTPTSTDITGREFSSTVGNWSIDKSATLNSGGTASWPSMTPTASGELYAGYALDANLAIAGSTSGYVYTPISTSGNGFAYNLNCTGGVSTNPVWGDAGQGCGVMVLVAETSSSATSPKKTFPGPTWKRKFKHPQQLAPNVTGSSAPVNISGVVANINVVGVSGTVTELIDGTGQVANVSISGQFVDETPAIYQKNNPQFPFDPLAPNFARFNTAYIGLKVQYNTALPNVFEPGTTSSVNVVSVSGTISEATPGAVGNVNVAGASDDIVSVNIPGTTGLVNSAAQNGSLSITTSIPPQYPYPPVIPNALKFKPGFLGLRVQYNTALPSVFTPGSASSVNVVANAGTITIANTGTTGSINVAASNGSLSVTTATPPQYPFPTVLANNLSFNPAYKGLRQQYPNPSAVIFAGSVAGPVTNVNVAALAGGIPANISGPVANINVSAQTGAITETESGTASAINVASSGQLIVSVSTTVNASVSALSGSLSVNFTGITGSVNSVANPGSVTIVGGGVSISGVVATISVISSPGKLISIPFNPNWWRVYRGYANWPTW